MVAVLLPVLALVVVAVLWVRARLAKAARERIAVEAYRASLRLPADQCRVVDVGWVEAWRTRRRVPAFRDVRQADPSATSVGVEVLR